MAKNSYENMPSSLHRRGAKERNFIFSLGSFLPKDACNLDRSRRELSNESLSMSLFLNLLFEIDPYSNEYLVAELGYGPNVLACLLR